MVRRVFTLGAGIVGLVMAMVVVMGLAIPASAFAGDNAPAGWKKTPVTVTISDGLSVGQYRLNDP